MRETTIAGLRTRITGGTDGEGNGDGPVVALLHGFGAPGDDLVGLARALQLPSGARLVFPEGPVALPPMGMPFGQPRAWWMIDVEALQRALAQGRSREMAQDEPEGLPEARQQLISWLDGLEQELGVGSDRIVLGGFSQGAMLALDVALHTDRPFPGMVLMSTTLLAERAWAPRMASCSGMPALQSHGEMDDLLPISMAEVLRDQLREAGWEIEWVPFRGGHEVNPDVLSRLNRFLNGVLAPDET
jgi:phospholipase/carboxylesterase